MNNSNFNVFINSLKKSDSEDLFNWINDRELIHFNNTYQPVHEVNHLEWLAKIVNKEDTRIFAIRTVYDEKLIGSCQLNNINTISKSAELQIRIGNRTELNKSYGTQAVSLLLRFGFNDLNLNRIYLHVFEDNVRAVRSYEKNNFQKEGILRQAEFINGSYKNVMVMSILKEEYLDNGK